MRDSHYYVDPSLREQLQNIMEEGEIVVPPVVSTLEECERSQCSYD